MNINTNFVQIIFSLMISAIIIVGSLMNNFEKYLPDFIRQTFRYGKFSYEGKAEKFLKPIEVPKSWFKHFYVYAAFLSFSTFILLSFIYFYKVEAPEFILLILNEAGGIYRKPRVTSECVLLGFTLFTLQCLRRFYDTHFVSIFGKNVKMNVSHYLIGYIHYTGCILAILFEAPGFSSIVETYLEPKFDNLNFFDYSATLLFLWAWWHQFKVTQILADLRKNKRGDVISDEHKLPNGDWFNYLSSPHMTAEILMYFALTVILWGNITWLFVFAWVLSNQVEIILMNHWWYQEKFKDFPITRKALIPFYY